MSDTTLIGLLKKKDRADDFQQGLCNRHGLELPIDLPVDRRLLALIVKGRATDSDYERLATIEGVVVRPQAPDDVPHSQPPAPSAQQGGLDIDARLRQVRDRMAEEEIRANKLAAEEKAQREQEVAQAEVERNNAALLREMEENQRSQQDTNAGGEKGTTTKPPGTGKRRTWDKDARNKKANGRHKNRGKDAYRERLQESSGTRRSHGRRSGRRPHENEPTVFAQRTLTLPVTMTVAELARNMAIKLADVIDKVKTLEGAVVTGNSVIQQDTCLLIVEAFGHKAELASEQSPEEEMRRSFTYVDAPTTRPPIVTVMGHVDHGKTSLLDRIRRARVADGESGGITQHLGAYSVTVGEKNARELTFLDTPGHQAFTKMRARGAKVTDIVILVVAANDSVKPQTVEAIEHAKVAGVSIVVAINKMDLADADVEKVKTALAAHGIADTSWGGHHEIIPISAKTGQGVSDLLAAVRQEAEVLELQAHRCGPAQGTVIEAQVARGRGTVATVILEQGTVRTGDRVLVGTQLAKIRTMCDDKGRQLKVAMPGMPVELLGLQSVPEPGERLCGVVDEKVARAVVHYLESKTAEIRSISQKKTMEELFQTEESSVEQLRIVLRADVSGSLEAIENALLRFNSPTTEIKIVGSGIGGISESDIAMAKTVGGFCIGFNVRADAAARKLAEETQVEYTYYSIIYELLEDIQGRLEGMLAPERHEEIAGVARVLQVFVSSQFGQVAGCVVEEGQIRRDLPVRVLRDNTVIFEGKLNSLRRVRDDVDSVGSGVECGIGIRNYADIREDDHIEAYIVKETRVALNLAS